MAVLHRVASGQIRRPRSGSPLEPLLLRMLALDPRQRPPVGEVAAEIARLGGGNAELAAGPTERLPRIAPPPPSTTVALPPAVAEVVPVPRESGRRRRPGLTAAVALISALLLAGLVILVATTLGTGSGPGNSPAAGGSATAHNSPARTDPGTRPASTARSTAPRGNPPAEGPKPANKPKKPKKPKHAKEPKKPKKPNGAHPPAPPAGTAPGAQVAAVRDYYHLLPGDTADAWQRLTAGYQAEAGGRGGYEQFWHGFRSVAVSDEQYRDGAVFADLTYTRTDGSRTSETRSFSLVAEDGILKIADSQVVS
jgi:hypothetical protein